MSPPREKIAGETGVVLPFPAQIRAVALVALLASGCWPARVNLGYEPGRARPLPAAGLHDVSYCVSVVDDRLTDDPLRVGQRRGPLFFRPSVRARSEPAEAVRRAVIAELRSRDLKVTPEQACDVHFHIHLEQLFVSTPDGADMGDLDRGTIRANAQGLVEVWDHRRDELQGSHVVDADSHFQSLILTARKYEWTLNEALGEFARRVVRHPDGLIAIQEIGARRQRERSR